MMVENHYQFLILGSGMAGLGAGITFHRNGVKSLILEKEDTPGGMCRTETLAGCDFDHGPKILILDDSENSQEILSFIDGNYTKYDTKESTYLSEYGLLGFPMQRHLVDLPEKVREEILTDLWRARRVSSEPSSFKEWLINHYGERFCELILFPYEEKKWQVPLDEMDYHWALSRPIRVSLDEVLKGSQMQLPPNKHYYYPNQGNIQTLTARMAESAGEIRLNHKVTQLNLSDKYVVAGGNKFYYSHLISSLPLDYVVSITEPLPKYLANDARHYLKRLGVTIINLVFKGNHQLEGTAIYFPEKEFVFKRISVLENLCPALGRKDLTPISVEIPFRTDQQPDTQSVYRQVLDGLAKIPQFKRLGEPVEWANLDINFAYPLQMNGLSGYVDSIREFYISNDVYNCGRGGIFDYCNSDQAYKQGADIARHLSKSP